MPMETWIGTITHFYPRAHAATLHVELGKLKLGDTIHIVGHGVDCEEKVTSLELDHRAVPEAREGQDVGVFVTHRVHDKADVFILEDPYKVEQGGLLAKLFK